MNCIFMKDLEPGRWKCTKKGREKIYNVTSKAKMSCDEFSDNGFTRLDQWVEKTEREWRDERVRRKTVARLLAQRKAEQSLDQLVVRELIGRQCCETCAHFRGRRWGIVYSPNSYFDWMCTKEGKFRMFKETLPSKMDCSSWEKSELYSNCETLSPPNIRSFEILYSPGFCMEEIKTVFKQ